MKLGKWLGLAVAAVILAEGIWAILVSLTRSLLLPLLARVLGGDPHSPLYLGTGDLNVPDLFAAVLQFCLAGILFLVIKAWAGKPDEVRISPVKKITQAAAPAVATTIAQPAPVAPAPTVPAAFKPAAAVATAPASTAPSSARTAPVPSSPPASAQAAPVASVEAPAAPQKPAQKPAAPVKPTKPREVYYNSVGEPINPTEEE